MNNDIFGNLMDWGEVLVKLEGLSKKNMLGKYQTGLVRILKFKKNWKLRETVLEYMGQIEKPSKELVKEVMEIMADENSSYDVRILAAAALGKLLAKNSDDKTIDSIKTECINRAKELIASPQPPIFHEAINNSFKNIGTK